MKKILAVASGGGHWIQLLRLRPAFEGNELRFLSTHKDFGKDVSESIYTVMDSNFNQKLRLIFMSFQILWVLIKYRPNVVITTGAAPGFVALAFGKLLGAKTIWLDSIANAEELSKSGKHAKRVADVWLTQWEHLQAKEGPIYKGRVL